MTTAISDIAISIAGEYYSRRETDDPLPDDYGITRMKALGFTQASIHPASTALREEVCELWCSETFGDENWGCLGRHFFFRSEEDATLFALRWA